MEYPGSRFTLVWRNIVLVFFILIFLISTPILILYTLNYRYDTTYGILKKTGALSIDALPKTVKVSINGQDVGKKVPIRFSSIRPETYTIHITENGYYDWNKEVEVKNQETTYIRDIQLLKKDEPVLLQSGTISHLSLSPQGQFLMYSTTTSSTQTVFFYNIQTNQPTPLLHTSALSAPEIFWSSDRHFAAIKVGSPAQDLRIFSLDQPQNSITLDEITSEPIIKIAWRGTLTSLLYYETARHELFAFNPLTKTSLALQNVDHLIDWTVNDDELWTMAMNSSTKYFEIAKDNLIVPQITSILNTSEITPLSTDWHFAGVHGTTVALQHSQDSMLYLIHNNQLFTLPASHLVISPYEEWWLAWNLDELWSYREGETPKLILRSGDQLHEVTPIDEYNTLLLSWQNKNTILFPYYFVSHDFLPTPFKESQTDRTHRLLYFSGAIGKQSGLWKIAY
jgi:hypothetical protein